MWFNMETIKFPDWQKIDIRMGKVLSAEKVEGADKLLKLTVDLGEGEPRQLVAGVAETHTPEDLVGKMIPILANLEPKKLRGIESRGMILAAVVGDAAVLLLPEKEVPAGTKVI